MHREYKQRLQDIGLAEKEAAVYMTLLETGAATADQTAKGARLNRSTTYVQLEHLQQNGLVTSFKRGKKTFFAAESPQNLDRLIETKRQKLELDKANIEAFIPDLLKVYSASGNAPVVRLYEGKAGIMSLRSLILESKQKDIYVVSDIEMFQQAYSKQELREFSTERARRKLRTHVLYTAPDTLPSLQVVPPQKLKRISQKDYPFQSDVYIFDDYVAFASYGTHLHGVLMQSAVVADTMRSLVSLVWENVSTYEPKQK